MVVLIQINKTPFTVINGHIHIECNLLNRVVPPTAEAETAGLFYNCQTVVHNRNVLVVLGHPRPAIPSIADNSTVA